jgi:hypothetical protein
LGFHKCRKNGRILSLNFAELANRKTENQWTVNDSVGSN